MTDLPFEQYYRGRKVLVTGDTGFTGSWLCAWLRCIGAEVYGLALPALKPVSLFEAAGIGTFCEHRDVDIRDAAAVESAMGEVQPDFVFHLAAQSLVRQSYRDPIETVATNVLGTACVLNACRSLDRLKGIVAITTDKVYQNNEWIWGYREVDALGGKDVYSASKAACELIISSFRESYFSKGDRRVPLAVARAGNIVGGGDWAEDRIVPDIVRALVARAPLKLRNPQSTRPWQHVLAACHGYLLIGAKLLEGEGTSGDAWNFGPDLQDNRSVADVIAAFARGWEAPEVVYEASPLAEAGMLMVDSQKARSRLGWAPVWRFEETLERTARWYARYYTGGVSAAELMTIDIEAYRSGLAQKGG